MIDNKLTDYIIENKDKLISEKKNKEKNKSNSFAVATLPTFEKVEGEKQAKKGTQGVLPEDTDEVIYRRAVISTANYFDYDQDVILPGAYSKSANKMKGQVPFLFNHIKKLVRENIIAMPADVKMEVNSYNWKDLGYNAPGSTETLVFNAAIYKVINDFAYDIYKEYKASQHSIGMRYIDYDFAVNSDSSELKEEKANFDRYISQIANRKDAEKYGYFWVVKELEIIEGSAVMWGANSVTPELKELADEYFENKEKKENKFNILNSLLNSI